MSTQDQHVRQAAPSADKRTVSAERAVAAVALPVILAIGMVAAVNLAIPDLQASGLRPSVSATAWIVDSYTLVFACLLIPAGALGDRFGRKRGMLIGLAAFAAGSALDALAPSVGVLMAGRAVAGIGAALVFPATLAATLSRVEPRDRPKAVALWSAATGIAGVFGNIGAGLALSYGGWRALFWAGVPIALIAALLFGIIEGPQDGWASAPVLGSFAAAVVLLGLFAWYETRRAHPMLDPRLFRLAGVRTGALGITMLFFALFGLYYLNAQFLQDVKGYSPLLTGVAVLPVAVVMPVISARSGQVVARLGERATVAGGLIILAAGIAGLSFATATTPYWLYGILLAVVSTGTGLAMPPLSGMIVHALPPSHAGVSSGLNSTTRELGSALGVAAAGTILTSRFAAHLPPALRNVPGAAGAAIRQSVTSALRYAGNVPDPAARSALIAGTHDAFTSGTSLGLRVGAALIGVIAVIVACQRPSER